MGYWNDAEKTAERYRQLPGREGGLELPEMAVFSGDIVRRDRDGFLYFIGRRDEMIKTSGYRVSPTEVEEVLYGTQLIGEAAAFGVPDPDTRAKHHRGLSRRRAMTSSTRLSCWQRAASVFPHI